MPSCRVCQGEKPEEFLDLGAQPHCNALLDAEDADAPAYPLKVFFCPDCTTVQIDHTVPKEKMFGHYLYVSGTTETLRRHFADTTRRLIARLGLKADDLVVDIGSNDGTWLKTWKPMRLRAVGVEPAKNLAERANAEGARTVNAFFNRSSAALIRRQDGEAALVTAAGVFFHLEELQEATRGVATLIGQNGVFCIQAVYLGEMLRNTAFDNIYHEHLTYWTVRSLQALLARYGMEIFSVGLLPIHGGSLEVLAAAEGTRKVEPSVAGFLEAENRNGYGDIRVYRDFAARVWKTRDELLELLQKLKGEGRKIFALGAPAKGATLLNSFGIGRDILDCATEVNPLKTGKFIPGVRLPILDEAAAGVPDAYLVLPWNFLPELLRKKRDYILNGGSFIVAAPRPALITKDNYESFAGSDA